MEMTLEEFKGAGDIIKSLEDEALSKSISLKEVLYRKGVVTWVLFDLGYNPWVGDLSTRLEYKESKIYYDLHKDKVILDINVNRGNLC